MRECLISFGVECFCLPVLFPKIQTLRYTDLQFCLLFCVGVELGFSHCGRNIGWCNTAYQNQLSAHCIVYNKSQTNFYYDVFRHPLIPFSGC